MDEKPTETQILDAAQLLVQTRGYNGFSYRDLAEQVGITTASIHYHFPTKAGLGVALVRRHRQVFAVLRTRIDDEGRDPRAKLERFVSLFRQTLADDHRMCLGGILATEHATLPADLQAEVRGFFEDNEAWLARLIEAGRRRRQFRDAGPAPAAARALFAALEGALLAARAFGDLDRFDAAARWQLGRFFV
jgi:TetR/AcrR family transcriptional repressor of nem operon